MKEITKFTQDEKTRKTKNKEKEETVKTLKEEDKEEPMKAKEDEEKAATSSTEEPTKSKMGDQKTNLKKTRIHKKMQSIGIHLVPSVCLCETAFYEQGKFLLHV